MKNKMEKVRGRARNRKIYGWDYIVMVFESAINANESSEYFVLEWTLTQATGTLHCKWVDIISKFLLLAGQKRNKIKKN